MGEATAKLNLDASGATRGAEEFARAAQIIFNSDRRMKEQVETSARETMPKHPTPTRKPEDLGSSMGAGMAKSKRALEDSRREAKGLGEELLKATGQGELLSKIFGKIASFKGVGIAATAIAAGAGFAKASYSANLEDNRLTLRMRDIRRSYAPGAANLEGSDLGESLGSIREERKKIFDPNKYEDDPNWIRQIKEGKDAVMRSFNDALVTGGTDTNRSLKRYQELHGDEVKVKEEIGKKQGQQTEITRQSLTGDTFEAERLKIEAEYGPRVQAAVKDKNTDQQKQLLDEQALKLAEVSRRQGLENLDRGRTADLVYLQGRDAGQANPVDAAKSNLSYARQAQQYAGTEQAKEAAKIQADAAEAALKAAEHEEETRLAILATDEKIASLRGSDVEKERQTLEAQVALAQKLLNLAQGRIEKENRALQLAQARKARDEFEVGQSLVQIQNDTDVSSATRSNLSRKAQIRMSAQRAQRNSLDVAVQDAQARELAAKDRLAEKPNDPGLQKEADLATEAAKAATIERARWERDIARSNADEVRSLDAQVEADRLRASGRGVEAQQLERRVAAEMASVQAMREGKEELAKRIILQEQAKQKQDQLNRSIDQETGKLKSAATRQHEQRQDRIRRRNISRSEHILDQRGGLEHVRRDSSGQIIDGIDPDTGQRVTPEQRRARLEVNERDIRSRADDIRPAIPAAPKTPKFSRAGKRYGVSGSAMDAPLSLDLDALGGAAKFLPQTGANNADEAQKEADEAANQAEGAGSMQTAGIHAALSTASATKAAADAASKGSGDGGPLGILRDIYSIISTWDKG